MARRGRSGVLTNSSVTAATYAGTVTLQSASSVGGLGQLTLSNVLSGGFGLTKVGSDTVVLTGSSNGSTTTTISAGTLQLGNGGTSGTLGSGAVTNNGTLVFDRTDAYGGTVSNAVSGSGGVTLSQGTLSWGGRTRTRASRRSTWARCSWERPGPWATARATLRV